MPVCPSIIMFMLVKKSGTAFWHHFHLQFARCFYDLLALLARGWLSSYRKCTHSFQPAQVRPCIIQTVDHHLEIAISTV